MEAHKVITTLFGYLEKNMVPGMSGLQEVAFYAIRETVCEEMGHILETAKNKPLVRAFVALDKDGNVDVEKLANRLRKGIECKGSLSVDIPLYGSVRFVPEDIDNILRELKEAENGENHQAIGRPY